MATTSTQSGPSGVVENTTSNFELVAQIIEQGLTGEPMFNNAPELLSALREGQVRCRVPEDLPDGVRWAYRQRSNQCAFVVLIHPKVWTDALATSLVGVTS
jgi:hypothetical protein